MPADGALGRVREEDADGWVPNAAGSYANPRYVVTVATLREDRVEHHPRSKVARRITAKLRIAEAYEAAEAEARERSGVTVALAARKDARERLERRAAEILKTRAHTLQGLAFKASIFDAITQDGFDTGSVFFVVHGRDFPANLTVVLGNPLLTA